MLKDVLVVLQRTAGALTCTHPLTGWIRLWHLLLKLWCFKHTNSVGHILACQLATEKSPMLMFTWWHLILQQCGFLMNVSVFNFYTAVALLFYSVLLPGAVSMVAHILKRTVTNSQYYFFFQILKDIYILCEHLFMFYKRFNLIQLGQPDSNQITSRQGQ